MNLLVSRCCRCGNDVHDDNDDNSGGGFLSQLYFDYFFVLVLVFKFDCMVNISADFNFL